MCQDGLMLNIFQILAPGCEESRRSSDLIPVLIVSEMARVRIFVILIYFIFYLRATEIGK